MNSNRRISKRVVAEAPAAQALDCQKVPGLFRAFQEKMLSPDAEALLTQHLQSCPQCSASFQDHEQLHQLMDETLGARQIDPNFDAQADQRLHRRNAAPQEEPA